MKSATAVNELNFDLSSVERLLLRTPLVALGEFRCPTDNPQFRGGGPQPCSYVVFPRSPVKISPYRGRSEICTPAVASYYNEGDVYDRHKVGAQGDNSDWIAFSSTLLCESTGFAGCFAPIASDCFLAQQRLFRRANAGPAMPALELEEAVVALLHSMVRAAAHHWRREPRSAGRTRSGTKRRRELMVDDAKQLLAVRFREELSLAELARQVNGSPAHLARAFRVATGTSLHEYRSQLRLRAAVPLLPDYRNDISSLAFDLGFSSHSHFAAAFRRQFGLTPSDYAGPSRLN